jgi:hypothetical protein
MRHAEFDKVNPHFKSKYASLSSIWDAVRDPLTRHGLSVVQTFCPDHAEGEIKLVTILMHKSGQSIQSTMRMPMTKHDPQGMGSAASYARRYALAAMVGATSDDDDDGNAASRGNGNGNGNGRKPAPAPAQQPTEEQQRNALAAEIWKISQDKGMDKDAMLASMSEFFGKTIAGSSDMSITDAKEYLEVLRNG